MPKKERLTGANIIQPLPGQPGVSELISNKAVIPLALNPGEAGKDLSLKHCGSLKKAADTFKPELEFQVQHIENPADENCAPTQVTVKMAYGRDTSVLNDFTAPNLIGKARGPNKSRTLLDQRLTSVILQDLAEQLDKDALQQQLKTSRDRLVAALDEQIKQLEAQLGSAEQAESVDDSF